MQQNEYGMPLDNNGYVESIMPINYGECFVCNGTKDLVRHEVFHGTANRILSKRFGLWVLICPERHAYVHQHPQSLYNKNMKMLGQKMAMDKYEWSKRDFINVFGRNYL